MSVAARGDASVELFMTNTGMPQIIESNPDIMMGKPIVSGTRVTVELILDKLGAGETHEQILKAHPRLTEEGILAALSFAADALRADILYPAASKVA